MLHEIDDAIPDLTRAERAVAEWVLKHPRQAKDATIADVARAAGTSEPTVVRFCRRVGVDGFRDFKLRLAEAVSRPGSYVHKVVNPDDTVEEAVTKVLDHSIEALCDLRARLAALPFEAVLAALARARQIVFAGLGASGQVARDAHQKFFRLGIPCSTATDTPMLLQMAAIAESDDVFVTVSHTGRWPAVVQATRLAASRGATTVALTDPRSPLGDAAGIVLGSRVEEDTNIFTPMTSRLAQLAVLDALQVVLAVRLGAGAEERLRLSKKALAAADG